MARPITMPRKLHPTSHPVKPVFPKSAGEEQLSLPSRPLAPKKFPRAAALRPRSCRHLT